MRYKLIIIFLPLILFSCKRDEDKFIGSWNIKTEIPYSAKLNLKKNQTFTYSGGAFNQPFHSNGNWIVINDTLILKSKIPDECFFMKKFGYICYEVKDSLKIKDQTTIPNCKPKNYDSNFINFEDTKFIFKNDSLIYLINKFDNCPDIINKYKISRN
jgi:hypothetical protein